jgi:hypothetical protein
MTLAASPASTPRCSDAGAGRCGACDHEKPIVRSPRGSRMIPNWQRLAAVAVLGEREAQLSAAQRLALVDAAACWLSEPNGGEELAYALLVASCSGAVTTEYAYVA